MDSKADFTDIYVADDPRAYHASLGELQYQIPAHGTPVFRRLLRALGPPHEAATVLDVCCSYGVTAALLNHDVTLDELRDHYVDAERAGLSRAELLAADRRLFAERGRPDQATVVGLDVAPQAVGYAVEVGLLAAGVVADLENEEPPAGALDLLAGVDLVTVTGGVGYVTERTFGRIVDVGDDPPWIAALTLRWIDFEPIAERLERHGMVTERLTEYVVPQRRFADGERGPVFDALAARGLRPNRLEEDGWHTAELFVARPEAAVRDQPLEELLGTVIPRPRRPT